MDLFWNFMSQNIFSSVLRGSLLIAGTAIGAGMLALPVSSGAGGFFPSVVVYLLCWLFSMTTGLLFFEIIRKMPEGTNIISLSKYYLGNGAQYVAWFLYIFLFYCLTVAYITVGGSIFSKFIPLQSSQIFGTALFTLVFGSIVYIGTKWVDRVNVLLMIGLVVSYFFFVSLGFSHIHVDLLKHSSWMKAFGALPIIFTAFSYQGLIPSLSTYFKHNRKILRLSIIIGSAIPFGIYIVWDLLIKGIVPVEGVHGLIAAQKLGQTAVEPLQYYLGSPIVYIVGQFFAFFALTTSFFGVTLPLVDFLADGLKIKKEGVSRIFLVLLVYLPALGISLTNPTVFFKALNFAGGVGCVFLLGLMPILMVWSGRYRKKEAITVYEVPGGKITLAILLLFIVFEVALTLKATLA